MPRTFPHLLGFACLFLAAVRILSAADSPARKRVALVIDDGPIPEHNAQFLELLAREHVHVTFSHIGTNVVAHPEMARAVSAAGHEINNHSYTHPHLKTLAEADIARELADTQAAVKSATGRTPVWFWAPFLEEDDRVDAVVRQAGLQPFPWKSYHFIGSLDWEAGTSGEKFRQLSTTGIVDGTVILMHEFPQVTLENLPAVITELKKQGVEFVTFSELASGK
jgi:peptidoglycan/xylan/chitin deacetylase (PgdA/CDA1 family)